MLLIPFGVVLVGPNADWLHSDSGLRWRSNTVSTVSTKRQRILPTSNREPSYDENFSDWARLQAQQLRTCKPSGIDWKHVAEELEEVAARIRHALLSDLEIVLLHLLKLHYEVSPNEWRGRSRNWKLHTAEHRNRVIDILENERALRNRLDEFVGKAYPRARQHVTIETGHSKSRYPDECPWSVAQILDTEFFPEPFKS